MATAVVLDKKSLERINSLPPPDVIKSQIAEHHLSILVLQHVLKASEILAHRAQQPTLSGSDRNAG